MEFGLNVKRIEATWEHPFEVVERKGRGHPDTICDLLADRISFDLSQYYMKTCGQVLHYNLDKALLVGGRSRPQFGGGEILEPAHFFLGDRAIANFKGRHLEINELLESSIHSWLNKNLRYLRLGENLNWSNEIKQGSSSLNAVESRGISNDTSVGLGSWPLTPLENMTLELEERINSSDYRSQYPELGEDIKVMAVRNGRKVEIILACAFVDRFVSSVEDYWNKKKIVSQRLERELQIKYGDNFQICLVLNALDRVEEGLDGLYLTVTGLSCEAGDSGQVGRGNRVNGLISFLKPQTMEAWAGKNPKSHIGKIYSFVAQRLAQDIIKEVSEIKEASVILIGKIGSPVMEPPYIFADFKINSGDEEQIRQKAQEVLQSRISAQEIFRPEFVFFDNSKRC